MSEPTVRDEMAAALRELLVVSDHSGSCSMFTTLECSCGYESGYAKAKAALTRHDAEPEIMAPDTAAALKRIEEGYQAKLKPLLALLGAMRDEEKAVSQICDSTPEELEAWNYRLGEAQRMRRKRYEACSGIETEPKALEETG